MLSPSWLSPRCELFRVFAKATHDENDCKRACSSLSLVPKSSSSFVLDPRRWQLKSGFKNA